MEAEQRLSFAIVIVLFVTYFCSLLFHLVTHRDLFAKNGKHEIPGNLWPLWQSVTVLAVATALIAWLSEFLVGSIEAARHALGLTETFVGVVVVALVGNAAEHSTAVWAAWKNKMDLSLTIATGSSLQMALFVTPVLVFCSYLFGDPMTLEFSLPEIASIVLSIWIVGQISGDGESNWLEGLQLLSVYVIVGILFYFLPALP
jgi:Ca2+:H+ antiporter